VLTQQI